MVFDSYPLLQYFNEANCGILLPLARRVAGLAVQTDEQTDNQ